MLIWTFLVEDITGRGTVFRLPTEAKAFYCSAEGVLPLLIVLLIVFCISCLWPSYGSSALARLGLD
jgi:hypothetical protein